MRIALAADHAGVQLKHAIRQLLDERGIAYTDFGTNSAESVDYPDFAAAVADDVAQHRSDFGILMCGSGIGMAIAANKFSREHNDANVLALGERLTPVDQALKIVSAFLDTPFAGGRHQRRVDKISALETLKKTKT